ncbi:MltA domain-containing protein [Catenovulum agarivorans]|uniref:MltA domain-containing protein n=1 Tax=Catenovulum agarivorans TaxID=1172192 RepID=UPI0002F26396|nr:MltA domain-containing protein [Catenovulum agarivorans]
MNFVPARYLVLSFVCTCFFSSPIIAAKTVELGQLSEFKGSELCEVSENTLAYLQRGQTYDEKAIHGGKVDGLAFALAEVKQTLKFICDTYRKDVRAKKQSSLHNNSFIQQNFQLHAWQPDLTKAKQVIETTTNQAKKNLLSRIPDDSILLTKYYTKLVDAKYQRQGDYQHALYDIPFDEQHLSLEQADRLGKQLTRYQYTRQQVMTGILEQKNLAKPLIYLTEQGLHDTLLQGTAVVETSAQTYAYYNVARNNGIAYDYALNKNQQARYWYFKQVPGVMGYGLEPESKIEILPQVTVAGNVADLGLGKLLLLQYQQNGQLISRLVILADEGGAFDDNLFQLDLLAGQYKGWKDYHAANKHLPDFVKAYVLIAKDKTQSAGN